MHGFVDVDGQPDPSRWVRVLDLLDGEPFYRSYKSRLLDLIRPVAGGRYLDVGGGTGSTARSLAARAAGRVDVVIADLSTVMAATARRRGSVAVVANAEGLPFASDAFDGCWADRLIQHVERPQSVVAEMVRVTRRGGRLVVVDPDYDTQAVDIDDQELARRVLRFRADRGVKHGTIAHRMPGVMTAAGLVNVQVEARTLVVRDPTAVDGVMGLRSWADAAHQQDALTAAEAAAWRTAIDRAVGAGRFLYTVTFFLTSATNPW